MDRAYWIKKYPRPDANASWCEECLRWEVGDGKFERARPPWFSTCLRLLGVAISSPAVWVAGQLSDLADRLQVRHFAAHGTLVVRSARNARN